MSRDEALHRAALEEVRGLRESARVLLLQTFASAGDVFHATRDDLRDAGLADDEARALLDFRLGPVERRLAAVRRGGVELLWPEHPEFPALLREIPDPPRILYRLGSYAPDELAVAIVGARRATHFARHAAELLAEGIVGAGLTVVSGFARGVDSCAHRGALAAGGRTAAVLGCGIDVLYPRENAALRDEIAAHGALFSEFPPGLAPEPHHFPRRNRLISGLSWGVVVVEASARSGSLITARLAGEQGREVFAVAHRFTDPEGAGCIGLIRDGVTAVYALEDILENLHQDVKARMRWPGAETGGADGPREGTGAAACSPEEAAVLSALRPGEAVQYDRIAEATSLSPARLATVLVGLELRGLVRQEPGLRYLPARKRKAPADGGGAAAAARAAGEDKG